jgi:hypothetical protein
MPACLTNSDHILEQNVRKFAGAVDGEDFNFGGRHKTDFTWLLNRIPEGKARQSKAHTHNNARPALTPFALQ